MNSILSLKAAPQHTSRPSLFMMPDPEPVRGRIETLEREAHLHVPGVFVGFALAGGVVLVSLALKWVYLTLLHIPFPPLR
jgi:hypothetical protein